MGLLSQTSEPARSDSDLVFDVGLFSLNSSAGSSTVRWENRTMYCVVSVFAVAV